MLFYLDFLATFTLAGMSRNVDFLLAAFGFSHGFNSTLGFGWMGQPDP